MTRFFLRIIADCCSQDAEQAVAAFLRNLHDVADIHMEPIAPYWKHPQQGEMLADFLSALPLDEIQSVLADHWEGDVADGRRSRISAPHAVFLWFTF